MIIYVDEALALSVLWIELEKKWAIQEGSLCVATF